jgi:hypothetical protein
VQYLKNGAPNPLAGGGYCEICNTWGHCPPNYPMLQKYQSMPRNLFCKFFKSIGHKENDFQAFDLLRERTSYVYRIQEENFMTEEGDPQYNNQKGLSPGIQGGFGKDRGK